MGRQDPTGHGDPVPARAGRTDITLISTTPVRGILLATTVEAMYQRIVIAVDETDAAMRAVREALALAHHAGGEVLLVHVGAFPGSQEALARAEGIARRAGVKWTTMRVAADDGIGPTIVREAERWRADLIVVGTHGREGVKRLLLGSVAESVARTAEVPVCLVRGGSRHALPG